LAATISFNSAEGSSASLTAAPFAYGWKDATVLRNVHFLEPTIEQEEEKTALEHTV
jgi:hypothetical protein